MLQEFMPTFVGGNAAFLSEANRSLEKILVYYKVICPQSFLNKPREQPTFKL